MIEQNNQIENLLQQGITAIKAKNKPLACKLLKQASDFDPTNATIWFWLSAALEDPYEQEECLQHVLMLDPDNTLAERGLAIATQRIVDSAFEQGVKAAEEQDFNRAQELLSEVVERDEDNLPAWVWLSQVVETSEDQEICFNNILALDPDNIEVQEKLELLIQTREISSVNPWLVEESESEVVEPVIAPTLAGDILGDAFREKYTTIIPEPEPEPDPPSVALWVKYDDNLGCPYCGNSTEHKQRRCPSCQHNLWISKHSAEARSTLLWIVILIQVMTTMIFAVIPLVILFVVAQTAGIFNFFSLIPAYLGLSSSLSPSSIAAAFNVFPRLYYFLSWVPAVVALVYTIALYLRWTPVYYFMLVSAVFGLASSIAGLTILPSFVGSIFAWGLGIILSLSTLIMVIRLESDFRKTRRRLYLDLDPNLKEGMAFMIRGKQYARKGMWALAAIHLRRGIALLPYEPDGYLATAVACSHLKDYDLARAILEDALRKDPDNMRIQQALDVLSADHVASENKKEPAESPRLGEPDTVLPEVDLTDSIKPYVTNAVEDESHGIDAPEQSFVLYSELDETQSGTAMTLDEEGQSPDQPFFIDQSPDSQAENDAKT